MLTLSSPSIAHAQSGTLVVALPFAGNATEDLLDSAYQATRVALAARSYPVTERATVRAALPVAVPTDTANLVAFGRAMGGTHVLVGHVTPLTGQYNLELILYEVATSRSARVTRNVGFSEEGVEVAEMVAGLWLPAAMQASPEELARIEAERVRLEQERQRIEAERLQQIERDRLLAQQRVANEARERAERERQQRIGNRFAGHGNLALGLTVQIGARLNGASDRPAGAPPSTALTSAFRIDGLYAFAPAIGLEAGASVWMVSSPMVAVGFAGAMRLNVPVRPAIPLRASIGATAGLFAGISGNRATTFWGGLDARAEFDIAPVFSVYAGGALDVAPGAITVLTAQVGFRLHLGAHAPAE